MTTCRPSVATPPLFPDFVVYLGMIVAEQDESSAEIRLPSQLKNAVPHRRAEFTGGRLCAREALKMLGATDLDIPMRADRSPAWPAGFVGSITHAEDLAFAAVARAAQAQSLGLDVEKIMSRETAQELAPIFATKDEYDRLRRPSWDHALLTTLLFSAKETIFKCLYPMIQKIFDFTDVEILSFDTNEGIFCFSLAPSLAERLPIATPPHGRMAIMDGLVHTGLLL